MSEYQYYEFVAVDRPLDRAEMQQLRALSTRARITPTGFVNSYQCGDFRGDPRVLMERYFDVFIYLANWGTRRVMLRLPARLLGRFLDTEELRDHLVAADACAFPSGYEPFGFGALEAMALQARTVVGPGFDETVVGSTEGACLRTTTRDPAELADALVRAVGDDDPAMGGRARRYVLDHHTWEAAATRTLQAYAEAVRR